MTEQKSFTVFGAGFHIRFKNGYKVSVQFGAGTYSDNKDLPIMAAVTNADTVETALISPSGDLVPLPWDRDGDEVQGWQNPKDVLRLMTWAASLE